MLPGQNRYKVDYDGKAEDLVRNAFRLSYENQRPRLKQWRHDYQVMNGFLDMMGRNPDMIHVFLPKIRQVILSKWPRDVKALTGQRPYFPFKTQREEFKEVVRLWEDVVDSLVDGAYYWKHAAFTLFMKCVFGFEGMDVTPYMERGVEPRLRITPAGPEFTEEAAEWLRLRFRSWAPWEVFPHPQARGCEQKGECLYLIKVEAVSKREIKRLAEQGSYPGLDIDKLYWSSASKGSGLGYDLEGRQMLQSIGLRAPEPDEDTCILKRYESEDRYIDVANEWVTLRDIDNPFRRHGRINFARCIHSFDPHTENLFFGVGEVKPNEIVADLLNDMTAMALNTHQQVNQPTVVHDSKISKAELQKGMGQSWSIGLGPNERVQDKVMELSGRGMPADHYRLIQFLEGYIDKGSNNYPTARGEQDSQDRTASEAFLLDQNAASTQEVQVRMGEEIFLQSLGDLVMGTVNQSARIKDLIEVVGEKRVFQTLLPMIAMGLAPNRLTPADLPGGYNFEFRGSDRVANQLLRQRNFKVLTDIVGKLGNVSPEWIARKALELWDYDDPDAEAAVIPDRMMMMMKMMEAEAQAERSVTMKQTQPSGGAPRQVATAREAAQQNMRQVRASA